MEVRDAIGIDPDSRGFVCALVKATESRASTKDFTISDSDLQQFVCWIEGQGDVIVALEGSGGLSRTVEGVLRDAGIVFYSFKAAETAEFRKAVLGRNKDNRKDAEAVGRYAMAMEAQGRLDRHRRVWSADPDLQLLSRSFSRKSKEMTAEVNRLLKILRQASAELYLALSGEHPQVEIGQKAVKTQGILTLLSREPELGKWKDLSREQMLAAMGGGKYKGREKLIAELCKLVGSIGPVSPALTLLIGTSAEQILRLKAQQSQITTMLKELTAENLEVAALKQSRGIATVTSCAIVAEIIDIRRFAGEDNLASYSGLVLREHSTGKTNREVASRSYNHRLKDALMTAARNFVLYNPDSHLSGYYRNLIKGGMSPMEATKRVARALVRVIYRKLSAVADLQSNLQAKKTGEDDMASGSIRSEHSHISNMPPSSLNTTTPRSRPTVKSTGSKEKRQTESLGA